MPDSSHLPIDRPLATLKPEAAAESEGFALRTAKVRIGQGPQNDVVLDDDTVSTSHALLEFADGNWRLTDLESRNGTYLEGVRLAPGVPTPIPLNAVLAFGAVTASFRGSEDIDAASLPPAADASRGETTVRRAGFRLPVWLLLIVIVLIVVVVFVFLSLSGGASAAAAVLDSAEVLVSSPSGPTPA